MRKRLKIFSYFSLNLHEADLGRISDDLARVDWQYLFDQCQPHEDGSEFAELIRLTVLQVCCMHSPTKNPPKAEPDLKSADLGGFCTERDGNSRGDSTV